MRNKWEATYADHIDFNRVIVVGDSAGANLAYRVSFLARDHEVPLYPSYVFDPSAFNTHPLDVDIKYQILLFPGTGALKTKDDLEKAYYLDSAVIDFFWSSSMGDLNETETEYINTVVDFEFMYRQRKQKGLPDAMIVSGSRDPLHRDAQQFAKQMSDEGVNVTMRMYNSSHAFHLLQFLEESKDVYNLIENVLLDRNLTGNYRCKAQF
jgi:acetyl esterase/lipase